MNFALGAIGVLAIIGGIVLLVSNIYSRHRRSRVEQYAGKGHTIVVPLITMVAGAAMLVISSSFVIVPSGFTGVKTVFGLIDETPLPKGFNPIAPFVTDVQLVNNKYQIFTENDQVWSESSEQTSVYAQGTEITYQINADKSAWVYANVNDYENTLLTKRIVDDAIKTGARAIDTLHVTARDIVCPSIKAALQETVDTLYGPGVLTIHNVAIADMDFEPEYNDAIRERQTAIVEQEKQAILNETRIEQAKAEAEAARAKAQGTADAELIEAEAKAEANKIIAESVTPSTQRQDVINKWDGKMPTYLGDTSLGFGILDAMNESEDTAYSYPAE